MRVARIGDSSVRWRFEAVDVTTGAHLVTADQTVVQIDPHTRVAFTVSPELRAAIAAFDADAEL